MAGVLGLLDFFSQTAGFDRRFWLPCFGGLLRRSVDSLAQGGEE